MVENPRRASGTRAPASAAKAKPAAKPPVRKPRATAVSLTLDETVPADPAVDVASFPPAKAAPPVTATPPSNGAPPAETVQPVKTTQPSKAQRVKAGGSKAAVRTARARVAMPAVAPDLPESRDVSIGTDAAYAGNPVETVPSALDGALKNISEVRHFFRTNSVPIYFVGATPFNLLGLDRWVRNFSYISYYDAWDGAHPRVFSPSHKPYQEFESGEEINNWLLNNAEVRAHMSRGLQHGVRPKVAMVFFDDETEKICKELGYDLILPPASLREHLDSKIVTTRLGNEAGVASAPNVLGRAASYEELSTVAGGAGLGADLVVQTPYGDSGKTTFFISSEEDWDKHSEDIVGQDLKVMRRINNHPVAVEAVLTRCGTVVGPFLTELTGYAELTPYKGGWCGNEMHPEVLTPEQRHHATELVRKLGDRLGQEGYRGFFEVDVLVDTDTDDVYLGELNPRISGASAITNVTAGAYADVPLFLFHLLEFMDVDFDLDMDEINARWEKLSGVDLWSHMIIKETSPIVEQLTATPSTGQYYLDAAGALVFRRAALDWHQLQDETEAFFLRIYGPGDYRWKGADLGVLVTKGRLQTGVNGGTSLTIRGRHFVESVRAGFSGIPLAAEAEAPPQETVGVKS